MKGLPAEWMQARDEIYSQLRGPAKNLQVLVARLRRTLDDAGGRNPDPTPQSRHPVLANQVPLTTAL